MRYDKQKSLTTGEIENLFQGMKSEITPSDETRPMSDQSFIKYLYAVQHISRYSAKAGNRGRPGKFDRDRLVSDSARLGRYLAQTTGDRLSLLYFISNCLPVLSFPRDLTAAFDTGKISLDEARLLARINRKNLGQKNNRKPVELRRELLDSHLRRHGTQKELRARVAAKIGDTAKGDADAVSCGIAQIDAYVDELVEFNESDTDHLFWEEIKTLVFLAREINPALMGEDERKELLDDLGNVSKKMLRFKPVKTKFFE